MSGWFRDGWWRGRRSSDQVVSRPQSWPTEPVTPSAVAPTELPEALLGRKPCDLTIEEIERLTDAFVRKQQFLARTGIVPTIDGDELRVLILQVVVDTVLTMNGALTIEDWEKP